MRRVGAATYSGSLRDRANVASFRGFERYDDVSPEGISSSVVVTGARYASDFRHLPMSVAVVDRDEIVRRQEASVLPLLTEQVPGLFVTGRGVMGYGVSDGAAGGISLRGIGGGSAAQKLVLLDGPPQSMGPSMRRCKGVAISPSSFWLSAMAW